MMIDKTGHTCQLCLLGSMHDAAVVHRTHLNTQECYIAASEFFSYVVWIKLRCGGLVQRPDRMAISSNKYHQARSREFDVR